jgi:hypothetical protein
MLTLASLLCLVLYGPHPASSQSQSETWYTDAAWSVNSFNRTKCVLTNISPDKFMFILKWDRGKEYLYIHMAKPSWNIPRNTRAPVRMSVDRHVGWVAQATDADTPSRDMLEFTVPNTLISETSALIRNGTVLRLSFLEGTEPARNISLSGSNTAMTAFTACVQSFGGRQLVSALLGISPGEGAQPFSQAPANTQPFAPQPNPRPSARSPSQFGTEPVPDAVPAD